MGYTKTIKDKSNNVLFVSSIGYEYLNRYSKEFVVRTSIYVTLVDNDTKSTIIEWESEGKSYGTRLPAFSEVKDSYIKEISCTFLKPVRNENNLLDKEKTIEKYNLPKSCLEFY